MCVDMPHNDFFENASMAAVPSELCGNSKSSTESECRLCYAGKTVNGSGLDMEFTERALRGMLARFGEVSVTGVATSDCLTVFVFLVSSSTRLFSNDFATQVCALAA